MERWLLHWRFWNKEKRFEIFLTYRSAFVDTSFVSFKLSPELQMRHFHSPILPCLKAMTYSYSNEWFIIPIINLVRGNEIVSSSSLITKEQNLWFHFGLWLSQQRSQIRIYRMRNNDCICFALHFMKVLRIKNRDEMYFIVYNFISQGPVPKGSQKW